MNDLFNTPFETGLRAILILSVIRSCGMTIDRLSAYDFMTIYGKDFEVSDRNLHGDNSYSFSELSSKRSVCSEGIKMFVLDGLIAVSRTEGGFLYTPNVEFSFDVAITTKNKNGNYMRLIHNKNVYALGSDQYTWNEVPNSHQVKDRADKLKRAGLWQKVRDRYLEKKNMYLFRQDHNHPSFVVYVEAVNEVYSKIFQ